MQNLLSHFILISIAIFSLAFPHDTFMQNDIDATKYTSFEEFPRIQVGLITIDMSELEPFTFIQHIIKLTDDPECKAILVYATGEGDDLGQAFALFNELRHATHVKPVITLIDSQCTSACYYIAAGANQIVASPTALIGGIGAQITLMRQHKSRTTGEVESDITYHSFTKGAYKKVFDLHASAPDEKDTAMIQSLLENIYERFTQDIAQSRNLNLTHVITYAAEGNIFTGSQAQNFGLIDILGSYSDTYPVIRKLLEERDQPSDLPIELIRLAEDPIDNFVTFDENII